MKPPFLAFVSGVRIARVMTMSSAFLEVLGRKSGQFLADDRGWKACTYIADKGLPGDRCLRMEPRRSTAIVIVIWDWESRKTIDR